MVRNKVKENKAKNNKVKDNKAKAKEILNRHKKAFDKLAK